MILHQQSGIRYCFVTWLCGRDFELPYLAPHFWHHHAPTRNRASSPARSPAYSSKIFKRDPSTCVRVRGRASIVRSRWLPFLPPSFARIAGLVTSFVRSSRPHSFPSHPNQPGFIVRWAYSASVLSSRAEQSTSYPSRWAAAAVAIYGFQFTHSLEVQAFQTRLCPASCACLYYSCGVVGIRSKLMRLGCFLFLGMFPLQVCYSVNSLQRAPPFQPNPFPLRICTRNVTPCHFGPISR